MIVIKSALSDFKDEIENISKEEKEIEKPYRIVNINEKILEFINENNKGMA